MVNKNQQSIPNPSRQDMKTTFSLKASNFGVLGATHVGKSLTSFCLVVYSLTIPSHEW